MDTGKSSQHGSSPSLQSSRMPVAGRWLLGGGTLLVPAWGRGEWVDGGILSSNGLVLSRNLSPGDGNGWKDPVV